MLLQLQEKLLKRIADETYTGRAAQHNIIYVTSNSNKLNFFHY